MGSLGDARASTHFVDRKEVQLAGFCMGRFLGGLRISMVALADVLAVGQIHRATLSMCIFAGACGVVALALCCARGILGMMCGKLDIQRYWHQPCTSFVAG